MSLTIIEPHEHFELIIALSPALKKYPGQVHIVTSSAVRLRVEKALPAESRRWKWMTQEELFRSKEPHICVFTSLQYDRKPWLKIIRRYPSALLLHNLNLYLPRQPLNWVPQEKTSYSWKKYALKQMLQSTVDHKLSRDILRALKASFHYSPSFALASDPLPDCPHFTLPLFYMRDSPSGHFDLLPLYGKVAHVDWPYFHSISWSNQVRVLCTEEEEKKLRTFLPDYAIYEHTPLSFVDFHQRFQEASRIIVPLKTISFGIIYEELEYTKCLARIHLAIQYQKPLLIPPSIPEPPKPLSVEALISEFTKLIAYLEDHKLD